MNTLPVIKLTTISITYKGQTVTKFVNAEYRDGRAYVDNLVVNKIMTDFFGFIPRGATFSIG